MGALSWEKDKALGENHVYTIHESTVLTLKDSYYIIVQQVRSEIHTREAQGTCPIIGGVLAQKITPALKSRKS